MEVLRDGFPTSGAAFVLPEISVVVRSLVLHIARFGLTSRFRFGG